MVSSDFRGIAQRGENGKSDRLFRAAVSAFASLPRPSKREVAQLAQLALPLFARTTVDARRFVAAVLSESRYAPAELVLRLCDEPVETCAPLLLRSPLLTNADLVRIIAGKGASHARVIARRAGLHPTIAALAAALDKAQPAAAAPDTDLAATRPEPSVADMSQPSAPVETAADTETPPEAGAAEAVRRELRAVMAGAAPRPVTGTSRRGAHDYDYRRLKETVLAGRTASFRSALADALGIGYETARAISSSRTYDDLIAAFRSIDLTEEEAFLLVSAACPDRFSRTEAIRLFMERYRAFPKATAGGIVLAWRADRTTPPGERMAAGGAATVHALPPRGGADVKAS